MSLVAERVAAGVLAGLLSGGHYAEERFGWEWSDWKTREGVVVPGEMQDFDWSSKVLILRGGGAGGEGGMQRVAAEDLDFGSKVRMLGSAPYQDRMIYHLAELEESEGFRVGVERLERMGYGLVGAYVLLLGSLTWLLAGWLHRSGSIWRWLASVGVFVVMTGLAGWLVALCIRQFGAHQLLEYVVLAWSFHAVLYSALVWVIYQSGPFRSLIWYGLSALLALGLPVTLGGTILAAQVASHAGGVDWGSCERYLTEVWLRPMGLL